MTNPYDPWRPGTGGGYGGPPRDYGQTRHHAAAPPPGARPTPPGPVPPQSRPAQPQSAQPRPAQPQPTQSWPLQPQPAPPQPGRPVHPQQQPPAGYPVQPGPSPQPPRPPAGLPPQPAVTPRTPKTALWISLAVVAVALIATAVTLAIWQPWHDDPAGTGPTAQESGPRGQEFTLDHGITVAVTVPDGWQANSDSDHGESFVLLIPESEDRTYAALSDDVRDIADGGQAPAVHAIVVVADPGCRETRRALNASPAEGSWKTARQAADYDSDDDYTLTEQQAAFGLPDGDCLYTHAIDVTSGRSDMPNTAVGLIPSISDGSIVEYTGT